GVIDDGWDVLDHVVADAAAWDVDPGAVAVVGESCGSMVAAFSAFRARESGLGIRAQVLVNPPTDLTPAGFAVPSMAEHGDSPSLTTEQLRLFCRLAVPAGTDPRALSPLHAADLGGLPPALVVVPGLDPLADQGRAYAARLREAGTPVELAEYERAIHGFISTPGLVPDARPARDRVTAFLAEHLGRR
ncbi:MAG TPA: alpha/beta hydrolase fold domain-containing protein, partial [Phytomonospora sp.]